MSSVLSSGMKAPFLYAVIKDIFSSCAAGHRLWLCKMHRKAPPSRYHTALSIAIRLATIKVAFCPSGIADDTFICADHERSPNAAGLGRFLPHVEKRGRLFRLPILPCVAEPRRGRAVPPILPNARSALPRAMCLAPFDKTGSPPTGKPVAQGRSTTRSVPA